MLSSSAMIPLKIMHAYLSDTQLTVTPWLVAAGDCQHLKLFVHLFSSHSSVFFFFVFFFFFLQCFVFIVMLPAPMALSCLWGLVLLWQSCANMGSRSWAALAVVWLGSCFPLSGALCPGTLPPALSDLGLSHFSMLIKLLVLQPAIWCGFTAA